MKSPLIAIFFLTLVVKGSCDCSISNINVGTVRSGRVIGGKPEWNVTVTNNCKCVQSQISLRCELFRTTEDVDPSILSKQGDATCILKNGQPLNGFDSVHFSYAWDPPFVFWPVHSVIGNCSL